MATPFRLNRPVEGWGFTEEDREWSMDAIVNGGTRPLHENDFMYPNQPVRGKPTVTFLMNRLRSPPLIHAWDFWYEKPGNQITPPGSSHGAKAEGLTIDTSVTTKQQPFIPQLTQLASITSVRSFWSVFNNFDLAMVKPRHAVHMFHQTIKPVWEDERNVRGGAWSFRVPAANANDFWREICMMAVGHQLQDAIEDPERTSFQDDICGVSYSPRNYGMIIIQIWNRDGDNEEGIQRVLKVVLETLAEELKPHESTYYYKKHADHTGFDPTAGVSANIEMSPDGGKVASPFLRDNFW